jgi:hypothetical protein
MTVNSVLEAVKTFIATHVGSSAPLTVDFLGTTLPGYSIVPLPGGGWIEKWITAGGTKEFLFAFRAAFSTADEAERLENSGFYEAFSTWLETQTASGTLPILPTGKTSEKIEALGAGFLYEQGVSANGIYEISCRLVYAQA